MLNARGGTAQAEAPGEVPKDGWRDILITVVVEQAK